MWKKIVKYDRWLVIQSPVSWLSRVHIMLPVLLLLFLLSAVIPLVVPIWTNFKVIIFINCFFGVCILFLLYRFEFLYYNKGLSFGQHFKLYLFNTLYLFLLLFFVFLGPLIMQGITETKLQLSSYQYREPGIAYDSVTVVTPTTPEPDTQTRVINPDLLSNIYFTPVDTSWMSNINYGQPSNNIDIVVLAAMDTNNIKTIRDYFSDNLAGEEYYDRTEIFYPASRALYMKAPDETLRQIVSESPYHSEGFQDYRYIVNDIVRKAINTPLSVWPAIDSLAKVVLKKYQLPPPVKSNFNYLLFEYYPETRKKTDAIYDNLNFTDLKYMDFDVFLMPFLVVLLINIYGTIILMARSRILGIASIFILAFIVIVFYSISYISTSTGYVKYVFITCCSLAVGFLLFSLLNKKIRTSILSHVSMYLLNYIAYIGFWILGVAFYINYLRHIGFGSYSQPTNQLEEWSMNSAFRLFLLVAGMAVAVFLNYPFLRFYYRKLIKPAK